MHGGPDFPIVFGNDIIMTSFLVTWFSNLHILWNFEWTINLPSFNFIDRFKKHNDDVMMMSFQIVGISNPNFVKLYIYYHPSKFQIFWFSGSNFMGVSVRH